MQSQIQTASRRAFLKSSSILCLGGFLMPDALFSQTLAPKSSKTMKYLELFNVNTKEHLKANFVQEGRYVRSELHAIDKIMADKRSGDFANMDIKLIDTLYKIHTLSGSKEPIDIICGYRSSQTNTKLSGAKKGVAKGSYHTLGKAADIKISGVSLAHLQEIAHTLHAGGVGYYPRSGFLHIDVGPVRTWRG